MCWYFRCFKWIWLHLQYLTFLYSQLSIIDFFVHYRLKNTVKFTVKVLLFCFSSRVLCNILRRVEMRRVEIKRVDWGKGWKLGGVRRRVEMSRGGVSWNPHIIWHSRHSCDVIRHSRHSCDIIDDVTWSGTRTLAESAISLDSYGQNWPLCT